MQFTWNYRDSWNKSTEERKFIRRLDACLITYATLSYFSKYIDLQNVTVSAHDPKLTKVGFIYARYRTPTFLGWKRNRLSPSVVSWTVSHSAAGKVSTFMATNSIILQLRGQGDISSGRFRQSEPHYYLQISKRYTVSHKLRSMLLTRIRPSIWVSLHSLPSKQTSIPWL